jgi:hypothetical protein
MADLKPLGSEKLQGMNKIQRILEIARYNETPKQEVNELSTTNYTIRLADGNTYGIVKERLGYIIKKGLNESTLDYSEHMKHRKYYRSYSEAMKRLNLLAGELNRIHENDEEIPLIGEQKFVLKTKKKSKPVTEPTPEPAAPPAAPPSPAPPADMSTEEPPMGSEDMGMGAPPMGSEDMDMGAPPMGSEDMDMGSPSMGSEDMSTEEPPMGDEDMGAPQMGGEEGGEPSALKSIQRLTGKLGQKIRAYDKEKGMDSQDIKYVVNSILSAIDLENLDEDDKDDILSKFEEEDEYGVEGPGELDLGSEDEFDMGGEPDMGDELDMGSEEPTMGEPKEMYGNVMDSIYTESRVESVLSKYFDVKPSEKTLLEEKRKKQFLNEKLNKLETKKEIVRLSETKQQKVAAERLIEDFSEAKFIGITNKKNLIFSIDGTQVKISPNGTLI